MKSKTIIISSEDEKGRGILTIFKEDDLLKCRIRLYNIDTLNRYCKLGIYHQNEVFSGNLLEKNGSYTSSMVGDFDIDKDFYAAIIDTSNNNKVVLSGGTYSGFFFNDNSVFKKIEQENPNTELYNYEIDEPIKIIDDNEFQKSQRKEDCERCKNCKYKEYFYSTQNTQKQDEEQNEIVETTSTNEIEENQPNVIENKKQETNILGSLVSQFQYVFDNYQSDETLNRLIPNGRFVKINENNDSYSIGAIYENEEMKYICYAVLKDYNSTAPQELGEHYQWLPLDKEDPLSEGYFIVFQDANDLKIVEI